MRTTRERRKWAATDDEPTVGPIRLFNIWLVCVGALLLALIEAGVFPQPAPDTSLAAQPDLSDGPTLEFVQRNADRERPVRLKQK